jgi:hypothetical protein
VGGSSAASQGRERIGCEGREVKQRSQQNETPAGQAAKYQALGFTNAKALQGGIAAWQAAGYPMAAAP